MNRFSIQLNAMAAMPKSAALPLLFLLLLCEFPDHIKLKPM